MELKPYQKKVIEDLSLFLDYVEKENNYTVAYNKYREDRWFRVDPLDPKSIPSYKNTIPNCPHVCMKVPTAGGKTFIACNALKTIFDKFSPTKEKVVVWLVPSITILDQTIKNLSNPDHPYRQKIETHFNGRVEVFTKDKLLQGAGFNPTTIKEQLNILVLSFDTFRSRNKEDRKIYQENWSLAQFSETHGNDVKVEGADETSLMNIINKLNPVVVVDESHNAETDLSVEMLQNLNPCFIFDLTATPRKNSNIISYVSSIELKKEHMVKLPVIVYNNHETADVISNALQLQKSLEIKAKELEDKGGRYIRPIVLFQAQPQSKKEENVTFEKIKEKLIKIWIPKEQIAIKTANINEIKQWDLLSKDCPVRYIITVNALKEGWDCPFAYILASLANKSSEVDVTQVLGRILRQPFATRQETDLLNISYVFTASKNFYDTLQNIIDWLNQAWFSSKQFRLDDNNQTKEQSDLVIAHDDTKGSDQLFQEEGSTDDADFDESKIIFPSDESKLAPNLQKLQDIALQQTATFTQSIEAVDTNLDNFFGTDLASKVAKYEMKEDFKATAQKLNFPQFFLKVVKHDLFTDGQEEVLLDKQSLLEWFNLAQEDIKIAFDDVASVMYEIDVKENTKWDATPEYSKTNQKIRNTLLAYIESLPEEKQLKTMADMVFQEMRKIDGVADKDIKSYIVRIIESFTPQQIAGIKEDTYAYASKIKEKIQELMVLHCEKQFDRMLDSDKVFTKPNRKLPSAISPATTISGITKSLYIEETMMNDFEKKVINEIANCENILRWHKNIERKWFCLNGHINHYPDFIVYTKSGKILIIETKGDDRDNTDSKLKVRLGKKWANKAGEEFKYFMVFDANRIEGAHTFDEFMKLVKEM